MKYATLLGLGGLILSVGCRELSKNRTEAFDSTQLAGRASRLEQLKQSTDSGSGEQPIARWVLPNSLNEISGLALTPDGNLLAHDDELGIVSALDYRRGVILKQYRVGRNLHEDFEGITIAHGDIYMLASNGKIYQFKDGPDGGRVSYTLHDTNLGKECEFEGVAYDSTRNELELSCKNVGIKKLRDQLVIYRWSLDQTKTQRLSRLTVPLDRIIGGRAWKDFKPSDIAIDPTTGNYVLISAQEKGLVVITPEGGVVSVRELPPGHDQAEGVAVTADSILIISDEAVHRPAAITLYRWP